VLRDSRLGASLVALKSLKPALRDEIGIPKRVGNKKPWGTTGALVYDVQQNKPAQAAGFTAGEIIVKVGDDQVLGLQNLKHTLNDRHEHPDGKRVKCETWRLYFPGGWQRAERFPKLGE
jgi:S1-C subfamily serine protease